MIQEDILSTMLYIVSTPIGNLKDITLRALETLQQVDEIICEDTRRSSLLLAHYQIKKPLLVLNDFNEARNISMILEKLISGKNLGLISDAGTPLISDPGYKLIRSCIEQNISVDIIPGPSAITASLPLSGLPPDKFLFLGYLPEKTLKRTTLLKSLTNISNILKVTFISFISPYKLFKTLGEMLLIYGDINIVLAKELTKIHQKVENKNLSTWLEDFKKNPPKGEYILLFQLTK